MILKFVLLTIGLGTTAPPPPQNFNVGIPILSQPCFESFVPFLYWHRTCT